MTKVLLMIIVIVGSFGSGIFAAAIQEEMATYKAEGECIAKHIAQGVERIDIATKDGTCWAETNGYYN